MSLLSEAERILKARFQPRDPARPMTPSDAIRPDKTTRIDQLVLPDSARSRMPLTKEKYVIRERPDLVLWERETRKFLRRLSPEHGHRVTAVMVFEWATGLSIRELLKESEEIPREDDLPRKQPWKRDIRTINKVLRFYFGKSRMTWIAGRKVPNAYFVKPGYYIKRHRPMTLALYAEYCEGTLHP